MTFRRCLALAALFALAGCAPAHVPWANSQVPKAQWARDWSACKREAEAEVIGYQPEDNSGSPMAAYDRAQAKRRIDSSVAGCMSSLGYVPNRKGE